MNTDKNTKPNPYIPYPVTIDRVVVENEARDIKTFRLVFQNPEDRRRFDFRVGQFAELSLLGFGESPIGIASSPLDRDYVEFTVKQYPTGVVTTELHNAEPGRPMGLRGPMGNGFPLEKMAGKNIVIISGGFAVTTLRATIRYLLHPDIRSSVKNITVIYGARSPGELCYKDEFAEWSKRKDIAVILTVDNQAQGWKGRVGFVPAVVADVKPSPLDAVCLICGPPVMLKYTMPELTKLGFKPGDTYLSFEMRMKCGIGKCGRCNIGPKYVCIDGPVFSLAEVSTLPAEY
ncbi:MAG: FAD/NAD(P)-binding protein [Verrucomicrobia bacterium]|nr:FAD/NAD(P)-binding protein [Verrucomicrobiota bacterium]